MGFYYVEHDGKTVKEYDTVAEFEKSHGKMKVEDDCRCFAVHPDDNELLTKDAETGRWVYHSTYAGLRYL